MKRSSRLKLYKNELYELYEDSLRSDGFDADYFNSRLTGHLKAAMSESIDPDEIKEIVNDFASEHIEKMVFHEKKAA